MSDVTEGMCWGLCAACIGWGFIAGYFYYHYVYCRKCLSAVMFVIFKLNQRDVFLSPYDRAVVNVAASYLLTRKGKL